MNLAAKVLAGVAAWAALQEASDYFPVKAGMKWTYETSEGSDVVKTVGEKSKLGEGDGWTVENFGLWGVFKKQAWLGAAKDGIVVRRLSGSTVEIPWLKTPLKAGDAWTAKASFGDVCADFEFRVAEEEEVQVPAGKFKAFKVTTTFKDGEGTSGEFSSWYAKGVGEVKTTFSTERRGKKTTLDRKLKKFEPEPGK